MTRKQSDETMAVRGEWNIGAYHFKGHGLLREYVEALKQRKILGSLCRGCGKVIVPPRNICGRCHRRMDARMVVSNTGTVTCFAISQPVQRGKFSVFGLDPVDMGIIQEGELIIPVFVKFDGADSNVHTLLIGGGAETVRVGMRVEAVFVNEPQGAMSDLDGVRPLVEASR